MVPTLNFGWTWKNPKYSLFGKAVKIMFKIGTQKGTIQNSKHTFLSFIMLVGRFFLSKLF